MLHWLAGQQKAHETEDPDTTECIDPPDTPAPVFAVRAFKQAIFGTPQPAQLGKQLRRHSHNDMTRPKSNARPRLERPNSATDARFVGGMETTLLDDPLPSPTKGILLTPGTAGARRKTVSFGDNVVDNETKKRLSSALPEDYPGKFPSPRARKAPELEPSEKSRGRSKLTEALEQVREESVNRKSDSLRAQKSQDEWDLTTAFSDPQSESGKYWKQEYDIYRERTTREVRKLVEKRKHTKDYARQKDLENTDLREQLRAAMNQVESLERRTAELEAQLKQFEAQGLQEHAQEAVEHEGIGERRARHAAAKQSAVGTSVPSRPPEPRRLEKRQSKREFVPQNQERLPMMTPNLINVEQNLGRTDPTDKMQGHDREEQRPKPRQIEVRVSSSTLAPAKPENDRSRNCRPVTSGTDVTPLQTLNVNTISQEAFQIATDMGLQPPCSKREKRQDSPIRYSGIAAGPPSVLGNRPHTARVNERNSKSHPESSPFQPNVSSEKPQIKAEPLNPLIPSTWTSANSDITGQAVTRLASTQTRSKENTKPSTAWTSLGGGSDQQRAVSLSNGNEMDADRVERAKARLASRGRQVS